MEKEIEERINQNNFIKTPVSVSVHNIDFTNTRLSKAEYFFKDIHKEIVFLFNSQRFQLGNARKSLPKK